MPEKTKQIEINSSKALTQVSHYCSRRFDINDIIEGMLVWYSGSLFKIDIIDYTDESVVFLAHWSGIGKYLTEHGMCLFVHIQDAVLMCIGFKLSQTLSIYANDFPIGEPQTEGID